MIVTCLQVSAHLRFSGQFLEEVVRLKFLLLLLERQHPRDFEIDPGNFVLEERNKRQAKIP